MTLHRLINIMLAVAIVILLGYLGPRLDETACLLGGCGLLHLEDQGYEPSFPAVLGFWLLIGLMVVIAIVALGFAAALLAIHMGWIK